LSAPAPWIATCFSRLSPRAARRCNRRRLRARPARGLRYVRAQAQIDTAITSVETLSRAVVRALRFGDNVPAPMPEAIRDLSSAVRRLEEWLDDPSGEVSVREPALRAAAQATLVLEQTGNLSVNAIVVQVRAAAVDLLRGSGVTREEAERLIREAAYVDAVLADADRVGAGLSLPHE